MGAPNEVVYWEEDGAEQAQLAKAVVLCANGAETPRLLLASESDQHPNGLANSSGVVGTNLMFKRLLYGPRSVCLMRPVKRP